MSGQNWVIYFGEHFVVEPISDLIHTFGKVIDIALRDIRAIG